VAPARRGARRRRRAAAALALAALPALGCYDVLDTTLNKTGFVDPFACVAERLRVYERINNNDVLIGGGDIQNPSCNANGISASGTISGGTAFSTLSKSQWEYGALGSRLLVGSTFDLGGVPQYALKYRYEATFQVSYEPATTTAVNAPRYFNYAWDYGLGAAPSATQSGTITIDGLTFPADWNTRRVVLNPMGGTLNVKLELEGFRNQAGKHYQGVVLFGGIQPSKPHTNLDCRRAFGEEFQFRVRTDLIAPYCSPGSVGSACEESSQCRENLVCRDGTCEKNLYPYGRIRLTF
jgi:hypothetical protein